MSGRAEASGAATDDISSDIRTRFDFYSLSRAVQDRWLASAGGSGVPRVLLFAPLPKRGGWLWLAVLILGATGVILAAASGYGNLKSPLAIQPAWMAVLLAGSAGAAGLGIAGYTWERIRDLRYPYRTGNYLFPCGVFIARDAEVHLVPISTLETVGPIGDSAVRLGFSGRSFDFKLPSGTSVGGLEQQLTGCRKSFERALRNLNRRELAALDPLRDSGYSNPLSSKEAIRKPTDPRPVRFAIGAVAGIAVGLMVYGVRNRVGERAIYAAAREADSVESYREYLARGGERQDVRELLLPRAELNAAKGSLTAVEKYIQDNPDSKILVEAEAALRTELLRELEQVKKQGSLSALADFKDAHPRHQSIVGELNAARHAVYAKAHQRFVELTGASEEAQALFKQLLAHAEKHGPKVEVRFRRQIPKSADRADSSIRRSAYFTGTASLPSQYLRHKHALPRENAAAERIVKHLQPLFNEEVLKFEPGQHEEGAGEPPAVKTPTVFVSYKTEMSGGYTTQRPRGVYVGLGLMMRAEFRTPDGKSWLAMKDSSWLPPDVNEIWRESLTPAQVYDRNARIGFNRFLDEYLAEKLPVSAEQAEP